MDFSFICKYCNKSFEIPLDPETKDFIIKYKHQEKNTENNNDLDMKLVKIAGISVPEISSNIDIIIESKICDNCYKNLKSQIDDQISDINKEIQNVDQAEKIIENELNSPEYEKILKINIENLEKQKIATEERVNTLNSENDKLQSEFDDLLKELKSIKKLEEETFDKYNKVEIEAIQTSNEFSIEKANQKNRQIEQLNLLNTNIFDSLFEIQINERYGIINGCKMVYKNNLSVFSEIYSGWGHILFLTNIINHKVKHFLNISHVKDHYIIYNSADYSYIYNIIEKKNYLFFETKRDLNPNSKVKELNLSMLQYLQILKDIDNKIKKIGIKNNSITDYQIDSRSINYFHMELDISNSEDKNWNYCMKSLLIILKYYITIIINKENEELKSILDDK